MAKWFRIHLSNIIIFFVQREVITNFLDATRRKKCSQFDGRKMTRPKKVFDSINCLSSSFTCVTQARNVTKMNKIVHFSLGMVASFKIIPYSRHEYFQFLDFKCLSLSTKSPFVNSVPHSL